MFKKRKPFKVTVKGNIKTVRNETAALIRNKSLLIVRFKLD